MTLKMLAAVALRGTARSEVPKPEGSALGQASARVSGDSPETLLLARAALAGLHSRAGMSLQAAQTPPPATVPSASQPLPESLWNPLRSLLGTPAASNILRSIEEREWTLSAAQVLQLGNSLGSNQFETLMPALWPLLDERGKAVLDTHPIHKAWQKADAEARWQAQLDALIELRVSDPAAGAARLQELWQDVKADERRDLLRLLRMHVLPEDLPLLQRAEKDRVTEIARWARQLQGHLPGELQDEVLRLLPTVVQKTKNKLVFKPFTLPTALGESKANEYDDSDLHRLLGAVPPALLLQALETDRDTLLAALEKQHWSLRNQMTEQFGWAEALEKGVAEAPTPAPLSTAEGVQQAQAALHTIQQVGRHWSAESELEQLGRELDPAAEIPAPPPLPFVMPPAPKQLPRWQTRPEWEAQQEANHLSRQSQAEAAWHELTEILRWRGKWAQALQELA